MQKLLMVRICRQVNKETQRGKEDSVWTVCRWLKISELKKS